MLHVIHTFLDAVIVGFLPVNRSKAMSSISKLQERNKSDVHVYLS